MTIIAPADKAVLDARVHCNRNTCKGFLPNVTLRGARAMIEYGLKNDPAFRLSGECSTCDFVSYYTYGDIYNLIPLHLRPSPLPKEQFCALMLMHVSQLPSGEGCFIGERVLLQLIDDTDGVRTGRLLTASTLTPTLLPGVKIACRKLGSFLVCQALLEGSTTRSLPFSMPQPGTADTGMFFTMPKTPNVLLSAQPFCSNPSCCHIVGMHYSLFTQTAKSRSDLAWFLSATMKVYVDCQCCGTSTFIDESTYDSLYKV